MPEWVTFAFVTALLLLIVITGRYWTFERITLFFCAFNFVYIPAAIWAMQTGNVTKAGWRSAADSMRRTFISAPHSDRRR